ncbi:MAG TPA: class IV adenylate cyclase, partial [Bryobacteraceae bacterium]|nr:class IV adenylate cyclase [Bryobacteraceae bacterium]
MNDAASGIETEVKIRIGDADSARRTIVGAGFEEIRPRIFEGNDVFDLPGDQLRNSGQLLRVRQTGDTGTITWKGVVSTGVHKSRPELETAIGKPAAMSAILEALGYQRTFRYEKYRTEFASSATVGTITLDETPIGNFL